MRNLSAEDSGSGDPCVDAWNIGATASEAFDASEKPGLGSSACRRSPNGRQSDPYAGGEGGPSPVTHVHHSRLRQTLPRHGRRPAGLFLWHVPQGGIDMTKPHRAGKAT